MNYVRKRRLGRTPYTTTNTAIAGPSHGNNWPLPRPLPRREGRDYRDTPNVLLNVAYGAIRVCVGTERPLPRPLPHREGRDYRDTPIGLLLVAYGVICGCITRCSAHFISLFVYIESTVKYVHSVILCLSVIMFITIKHTTQHVLSVMLCLYVILSIIMFASRGGGVCH